MKSKKSKFKRKTKQIKTERNEELRNKVYDWTMELLKEGKTSQGLVLMLATWNFASFRYGMTSFPLKEFEKCLSSCDFYFFKDKDFKNINLEDPETKERISNIYSDLSSFKGVKYVGASKIMHFMCPQVLVMWDTKIRKYYGFHKSADGYLSFLKKMQQDYKSGKFKNVDGNVSIPRAVDMLNLKIADKRT